MAHAQTVAISATPASGVAGGTSTFNLSIASGGAAPSSLQWSMSYSIADISSLSVKAAGTAVSAGDTILCANGIGKVTCLAYGMAQSAIADGVIAQVTVNLSPTTSATLTAVQIGSTSASNASGTSLSSTGAGTQIAIQIPLGLSSLTCAAGSINTPGNTTCTISLNGTAPAGGFPVSLSSTNSALSVPTSVTVPANAASTTFSATAAATQLTQSATISAIANGITKTATLTLSAPVVFSSLQCAAASLSSNASTTCTVTLANAAPAGGSIVSLGGTIAGVLTLPLSVTVPANATSASFTASTGVLSAIQIAVITASLNGSSISANLSLTTQTVISSLQCAAASLISNASTTCTVKLANAAPAGGSLVSLSGAIAGVLSMPSSVTVPANATSASFTATAGAISSQQTAVITASLNGSSQQTSLSLNAPVMISDVQCTAATLASNGSTTCTVTLTGAAPAGGTVVAITGAIAKVFTLPASVTVPANSTTANFTVSTGTVATDQTAAITVSVTIGSVRQTAATWIQLTSGAVPVTVSTLQCSATSLTPNAGTTCSVILSAAAPAGGAAVTVSASNPALTAPASVTIAAGSTSTSFAVSANTVTSTQTSVITASYGGASQTVSLTVTALSVTSLQCNPATVTGGSPSTCTVTLSANAPSAGAVIALSGNNAAATVPVSLTIAAGTTSNTFVVTTSTVSSSQTVSLSAAYGGGSQTATLTVAPIMPSSLQCASPTINSGSATTCTVSLNTTATASGLMVALSSSSPNLKIPAKVMVPSGALTATFSANAGTITADESAMATASCNGGSRSAALMLSAPPQLTGLSCVPAKVASGTTATCTATLSKAVSSNAVVTLSGGNTLLSIPADVTIAPGSASATFIATASGATTQVVALTSSWNGVTVPFSLTVTPPAPTFSILGTASEVSGVTNGSSITPTYAPAGLAGTVVVNGTGSVTFAPDQNGNGVYFQNCCQNTNNAYYKFTGTAVGNVFNFNQGQISFSLTSRSNMTQRARATSYRSVVDVRDGDTSNHLVSFATQVSSGSLVFYYNVGKDQLYYIVPKGTEAALFGTGVTLQVTLAWSGNTLNLYLNGTLVKSSAYAAPAGNWTAASVLDLGAHEYLTYGGYDSCDDVISGFAVGPKILP